MMKLLQAIGVGIIGLGTLLIGLLLTLLVVAYYVAVPVGIILGVIWLFKTVL
jgi:hypothetical protein